MAICRRCRNFYFGSECAFCKTDPEFQREEQIRAATEADLEKRRSAFLFSTTHQLEGYSIVLYHGVVSGSAVIGTGWLSEFRAGFSDLFGTESNAFSDKLNEVRKAAMDRAMNNALSRGANALIGIDVDYQMFSGNMIAAIVTGTAVLTEKQ